MRMHVLTLYFNNVTGFTISPPNREMFSEVANTILSITYYIISKANSAEGDEGEVKAFSITPSFHVTEDHWWENQKNQCSNCQKKSHC